MIQNLSSQLLNLSKWDRRVSVNAMEGLGTNLMTASSMELNSSHQVLEERRTSSTPFTVKKQINYQESGIYNLMQLTSNPETLLPTPALWFKLSRGDLIIITFITVMLRFTLQSFHLNLTLKLFQIKTPLQLNQLMMMKCNIYWNCLTQNTINIF